MTQPPQNPGTPPAYGTPSYAPAFPPPASGSGGKGKLWAIIGCAGCGLIAVIAAIAVLAFVVLREPAEDPTPTPTPTTSEPETTEPETTEPETTEPETTEPETTEPETTEPETTAAAAGEVTAEDEAAAKQRFLDFITALGAEDYAGACGFVLNPNTGGAFTGVELDVCEQILTDSANPEDTEGYKALSELITVDDIESAVNDDGSITLTVFGSEFPLSMVRGTDGLWYVDVS